MTNRLKGVLVLASTLVACAPQVTTPGVQCGAGTLQSGDQCVPAMVARTCAAGTHEEGGTCVADPMTPVTCGAGTHLEGMTCVVTTLTPPPSPWSPPTSICEPGTDCSAPVVVQTEAGTAMVVAETSATAYSAALYTRTGDGAFTLAQRFEGTSRIVLTPTVAAKGSTLYVVYADYEPSQSQQYGRADLRFTRSTDFGRTWSPPVTVNPTPATTLLYSPYLSVTSRGLDLFFLDTDGQQSQALYWSTSADDGATFTTPQPLPAGGPFDYQAPSTPGVLVGDALEVPMVHDAYNPQTGQQHRTVAITRLPNDPAQPASTVHFAPVFNTRDFPLDPVPVLSVNPRGVRCLAFLTAPSRDLTLNVVRSEAPFTGLERPVLLPDGAGAAQLAPAIAALDDGGCDVAWLDNRSGAWDLYEAVLHVDGTWSTPVKVTPMSFIEDGVTTQLTPRLSLQVNGNQRTLVFSDLHAGTPTVSVSVAPTN